MTFYSFMPKLFNMSLTASVAIVCVILLRMLLKKAPKVISYALWGVVLFRLLCPVSIESSFSMYHLFDAPVKESGTLTNIIEYVPNDIVHTEHPTVTLPVPGISDVINEALPQGEEQLRADPLEGPIFIATYVWMAGVLVMVIYSAASYGKLRHKLSVVIPLRDNIFIADDIKSPFVVGLFCPKIYLPCNLGEREQEYIILHEQHHIKRFDHVMKALAFFALTMHWFNSLVWVAFVLAGKDMEMSCDESVIRKVGSGVRADYSASLLTLATGRRIIAGTPLAFGEGDTKDRINNLSRWKKPTVWVVLTAVVACVVLAVSLLTNPETKQDLSSLSTEQDPAADYRPPSVIVEIIDPTDDPDFAYDTAIEKIYEDEDYLYYLDGLYSQHIIVHYADGKKEDIVSALNSKRAMIDDLKKFDIPYRAVPKYRIRKIATLDAAINIAIMNHYRDDDPDRLLYVKGFEILHQETDQTGKTTVIVMSLRDQYDYTGHNKWYEPVKLSFGYTNERGYYLTDSWFPTRPTESWDALSDEVYKEFSAYSEDLADSALNILMDKSEHHDMEWIKENQPEIWLLLQMMYE